jgi:hypothetical protein
VPLKPGTKSAGRFERSRSKRPLETKDPAKMDAAELIALFAKDIDLSAIDVVKNYIRGGVLVEDLPEGRTVREYCGVIISLLVAYHDNNLNKPISEQTSGVMVTFKPKHFYHDYVTCFPVNWEDLYLLINLREMDSSIVRGYTM